MVNTKVKETKTKNIAKSECGFVASGHYTLSNHGSVHAKTGDTPYKCNWTGCDKSFYNAQSLKGHKMIHTGEKPFICDWPGCGRSFRKRYDCEVHRHKIHIKDFNIKCEWPDCQYRALRKYELKLHIRRVHQKVQETSGTVYQCPEEGCQYSTHVKLRLYSHKR